MCTTLAEVINADLLPVLIFYPARDGQSGRIETIDDMILPGPWQHLQRLLRELGRVEPIHSSNEQWLSIQPEDVLARIDKEDPSWEAMVPAKAAEIIKSKGLFRTNAVRRVDLRSA